MPQLSVIIPTLNSAGSLAGAIACLCGYPSETIVSDGGSEDGTVAVAEQCGCTVVTGARGRGAQLAAGIAASRGDWLLLLHADTILAEGWEQQASQYMAKSERKAGYFRFALDSADPRARRLERRVAWRCRRLGLPYGDQGLLISRRLLDEVGGMRPMPLMEDVDLVRRIGAARLTALAADAVTSALKWERDGWRRRSIRNLTCLSLYFAGVPPSFIARFYS